MDKRVKEFDTWTSVLPCIDKYIYDYNFKIPHSGLDKGPDGFHQYPCEVYFNQSLKAIDLNSTNIKIDEKGTISLAQFLQKKNSEDAI